MDPDDQPSTSKKSKEFKPREVMYPVKFDEFIKYVNVEEFVLKEMERAGPRIYKINFKKRHLFFPDVYKHFYSSNEQREKLFRKGLTIKALPKSIKDRIMLLPCSERNKDGKEKAPNPAKLSHKSPEKKTSKNRVEKENHPRSNKSRTKNRNSDQLKVKPLNAEAQKITNFFAALKLTKMQADKARDEKSRKRKLEDEETAHQLKRLKDTKDDLNVTIRDENNAKLMDSMSSDSGPNLQVIKNHIQMKIQNAHKNRRSSKSENAGKIKQNERRRGRKPSLADMVNDDSDIESSGEVISLLSVSEVVQPTPRLPKRNKVADFKIPEVSPFSCGTKKCFNKSTTTEPKITDTHLRVSGLDTSKVHGFRRTEIHEWLEKGLKALEENDEVECNITEYQTEEYTAISKLKAIRSHPAEVKKYIRYLLNLEIQKRNGTVAKSTTPRGISRTKVVSTFLQMTFEDYVHLINAEKIFSRQLAVGKPHHVVFAELKQQYESFVKGHRSWPKGMHVKLSTLKTFLEEKGLKEPLQLNDIPPRILSFEEVLENTNLKECTSLSRDKPPVSYKSLLNLCRKELYKCCVQGVWKEGMQFIDRKEADNSGNAIEQNESVIMQSLRVHPSDLGVSQRSNAEDNTLDQNANIEKGSQISNSAPEAEEIEKRLCEMFNTCGESIGNSNQTPIGYTQLMDTLLDRNEIHKANPPGPTTELSTNAANNDQDLDVDIIINDSPDSAGELLNNIINPRNCTRTEPATICTQQLIPPSPNLFQSSGETDPKSTPPEQDAQTTTEAVFVPCKHPTTDQTEENNVTLLPIDQGSQNEDPFVEMNPTQYNPTAAPSPIEPAALKIKEEPSAPSGEVNSVQYSPNLDDSVQIIEVPPSEPIVIEDEETTPTLLEMLLCQQDSTLNSRVRVPESFNLTRLQSTSSLDNFMQGQRFASTFNLTLSQQEHEEPAGAKAVESSRCQPSDQEKQSNEIHVEPTPQKLAAEQHLSGGLPGNQPTGEDIPSKMDTKQEDINEAAVVSNVVREVSQIPKDERGCTPEKEPIGTIFDDDQSVELVYFCMSQNGSVFECVEDADVVSLIQVAPVNSQTTRVGKVKVEDKTQLEDLPQKVMENTPPREFGAVCEDSMILGECVEVNTTPISPAAVPLMEKSQNQIGNRVYFKDQPTNGSTPDQTLVGALSQIVSDEVAFMQNSLIQSLNMMAQAMDNPEETLDCSGVSEWSAITVSSASTTCCDIPVDDAERDKESEDPSPPTLPPINLIPESSNSDSVAAKPSNEHEMNTISPVENQETEPNEMMREKPKDSDNLAKALDTASKLLSYSRLKKSNAIVPSVCTETPVQPSIPDLSLDQAVSSAAVTFDVPEQLMFCANEQVVENMRNHVEEPENQDQADQVSEILSVATVEQVTDEASTPTEEVDQSLDHTTQDPVPTAAIETEVEQDLLPPPSAEKQAEGTPIVDRAPSTNDGKDTCDNEAPVNNLLPVKSAFLKPFKVSSTGYKPNRNIASQLEPPNAIVNSDIGQSPLDLDEQVTSNVVINALPTIPAPQMQNSIGSTRYSIPALLSMSTIQNIHATIAASEGENDSQQLIPVPVLIDRRFLNNIPSVQGSDRPDQAIQIQLDFPCSQSVEEPNAIPALSPVISRCQIDKQSVRDLLRREAITLGNVPINAPRGDTKIPKIKSNNRKKQLTRADIEERLRSLMKQGEVLTVKSKSRPNPKPRNPKPPKPAVTKTQDPTTHAFRSLPLEIGKKPQPPQEDSTQVTRLTPAEEPANLAHETSQPVASSTASQILGTDCTYFESSQLLRNIDNCCAVDPSPPPPPPTHQETNAEPSPPSSSSQPKVTLFDRCILSEGIMARKVWRACLRWQPKNRISIEARLIVHNQWLTMCDESAMLMFNFSPSLWSDIRHVLREIDHFDFVRAKSKKYRAMTPLHKALWHVFDSATQVVNARVITDSHSPFASCESIGTVYPKPRHSLTDAIAPDILRKMKALKENLRNNSNDK